MGQARQRKIAKAVGRPWSEDAPPPPKPKPWYMTEGGLPPFYPIGMDAPPPEESTASAELMQNTVVRLENGPQVLIVGDDPRGLPVRRRHNSMETALLMAALSLNGQPLIKSPKR
jgi:hypothetical protein